MLDFVKEKVKNSNLTLEKAPLMQFKGMMIYGFLDANRSVESQV